LDVYGMTQSLERIAQFICKVTSTWRQLRIRQFATRLMQID